MSKIYDLTDKLTFGKHKGETIQEVIDDDITYIEWALDNIDGFELTDMAMEMYETALEEYYRNDPEFDFSPGFN